MDKESVFRIVVKPILCKSCGKRAVALFAFDEISPGEVVDYSIADNPLCLQCLRNSMTTLQEKFGDVEIYAEGYGRLDSPKNDIENQ